ncbi:penicillin-binding protein activator [Fodinicurvata fenggangensis]|uniref:penicillin-binding protein activator n=1 Tax=Fodinicurvata fenggangensis TaxID=1121830 RepID=UPI000690B484|nr:penicillin-binding protein activator [Fodinicurvata fenggangensis]
MSLLPTRFLAIFLILGLAACQSQQATQPDSGAQQVGESAAPESQAGMDGEFAAYDDGRTRIALLAPLSGEHRALGRSLVNAAQMALFRLAGNDFELVVKDAGDTAREAQDAMDEALNEDVQLVLGPLFSQSVSAIGPQATRAGVPVLAFSNDRSVAAPGVYVMGIGPANDITRVIQYSVEQGRDRIAILAPRNSYGQAVQDAAQRAASRYGATITQSASYDPADVDISNDVRALAQSASQTSGDQTTISGSGMGVTGFNSLLIPAGGREVENIAPLLPYYDINPEIVQLLGSRLWENGNLGRDPVLSGGWFAAPEHNNWETFARQYEDLYGEEPPRVASIAYDATALAAALARDAETGDNSMVYDEAVLTDSDGYTGVDGLFRMLPNGEVERGLAVYELTDNGFQRLDPAPSSFERLLN